MMSPTPAERIVTPDAERLYIDRAGLAHRVEDLEPDLQREIEEALARAHEILPRQEALAEASRLLQPYLRALPPADQIAVALVAARAIDEATFNCLGWRRCDRHLRRREVLNGARRFWYISRDRRNGATRSSPAPG
jgi:hypothetical protein